MSSRVRARGADAFARGLTRAYVLSDCLDLSAIVAYAGASGDMNPIHFDPDRAEQSSGSRELFAQGMLTMGLTASAIEDFAGSFFLSNFGGRFLRPVWAGSSLDCLIQVEAVECEASNTVVNLAVEVRANHKDPVFSGHAVLLEMEPR